MHNLFAVQRLIEKAKEHGKVKEISIEMGELCELHDHDIKSKIEDLTNWQVNFNIKKAKVKCTCGYEGEPKIVEKTHDLIVYICPKCGLKPKIIEGDALILKEVKIL